MSVRNDAKANDSQNKQACWLCVEMAHWIRLHGLCAFISFLTGLLYQSKVRQLKESCFSVDQGLFKPTKIQTSTSCHRCAPKSQFQNIFELCGSIITTSYPYCLIKHVE